MQRLCWKLAVCLLALSAATVGLSAEVAKPATEGKAAVDTGASAPYEEVYDQLKKTMAELAEYQIKLQFGSQEQRKEVAAKYVQLVKQLAELTQKLQAVAEKAYIANDKDEKLGLLLMTIAIGDLRKDNYEDALRLAKLLIEHHYPNKDIYRIAASAAFTLMQLDEAQKYLDDFNGGQPPTDERLAKTQFAIGAFRPKWEREEKLRTEEAKADDLPRVKLHTTAGDIVLELFENEAPNTVANFISLVEKGFYDGVQFHRVLPNFMAQTGDPISIDPAKHPGETIGSGGPGYTIEDECRQPNHRDHFRGSLSMAHTSERNSGGSQFFLTFVPTHNPFAPTDNLDGVHTVFGRIVDGMDVLSKIQRVESDPKNPKDNYGIVPDKILKAEVLRKRDHPYEPKTLPGK